ncbi:TetR/AcrR family transcriptional regulator [Pseudomonas muyukensis]|uniref:TetR/AcrR family transcriptional regulator n=1 Tax=Pseudomonas muyukensis TaxID=2842357 RepID=A0ABX8MHJ3_9PSED|nr:TetR/AcrR family transcriptional regulator [Pseudomonas muyukensis]QXH37644.1 TetR/AcrR family transcriptional regulator [Pseudomonas muyukensis]
MRPSKISREELLQRCALVFKRHGYHGTTMDMLSVACGLTKASFYHHFPSKDGLLREVLKWTHEGMSSRLFAIAYQDDLTPAERLEKMGRKTARLFQSDTVGCLMAVVGLDASYGKPELLEPVRSFFDEWAKAFAHLFAYQSEANEALVLGQQLVADMEGAILLTRIHGDPQYIDRVIKRGAELLQG